MRNSMGDEAEIYPETAAVIDLDVYVPPGTDYKEVDVRDANKFKSLLG